MKTLRLLARALVALAVLVAAGSMAVPLTFAYPPSQDAGPTAKELVSQAVSNTIAANSFHVDFNAGLGVPELSLRESYTLTADLGPAPRQGRLRASYSREGPPNFRGTFLSFGMVMTSTVDVVSNEPDGWRESYDGGATWIKPSDFTPAFVSTLLLCPVQASIWLMCSGREIFIDSQMYKAGSPAIEDQDGVTVRHFVAQYKLPDSLPPQTDPLVAWVHGIKTIDLWTSTGATPTIAKMKIAGVYDVTDAAPNQTPGTKVGNGAFTLDYRLSRFNEDFGSVNAPAAEPTPTPLRPPTATPTAAPPPAAGMPRTGEELGAEPHLLDIVLIAALATALAGLLVRLVASRR